MNRREFIRNTVVGTAGLSLLGLPALSEAAADSIKLTILHTNDMHSRIDPFPEGKGPHAGMGGMARRTTLIKNIRSQEPHVLLLDSGDIFQGTPYFNFFGGELEYKLMTQMQYDCATLGNHDFDNGLDGLLKQLPHAGFPFVNANYDFSETILKDQFKPYKIFEKGGLKIGVFGLGIDLQGLVSPNLIGKVQYLDPVIKATEMVSLLKSEEKCNFIICLSHLGYHYDSEKIDDRKIAQKVSGINLILGGHTHTFMEKPETVTHASGHQTLINQVGWAGINVGRLDYTFNKRSKKQTSVATAVLPVIAPDIKS